MLVHSVMMDHIMAYAVVSLTSRQSDRVNVPQVKRRLPLL